MRSWEGVLAGFPNTERNRRQSEEKLLPGCPGDRGPRNPSGLPLPKDKTQIISSFHFYSLYKTILVKVYKRQSGRALEATQRLRHSICTHLDT